MGKDVSGRRRRGKGVGKGKASDITANSSDESDGGFAAGDGDLLDAEPVELERDDDGDRDDFDEGDRTVWYDGAVYDLTGPVSACPEGHAAYAAFQRARSQTP